MFDNFSGLKIICQQVESLVTVLRLLIILSMSDMIGYRVEKMATLKYSRSSFVTTIHHHGSAQQRRWGFKNYIIIILYICIPNMKEKKYLWLDMVWKVKCMASINVFHQMLGAYRDTDHELVSRCWYCGRQICSTTAIITGWCDCSQCESSKKIDVNPKMKRVSSVNQFQGEMSNFMSKLTVSSGLSLINHGKLVQLTTLGFGRKAGDS